MYETIELIKLAKQIYPKYSQLCQIAYQIGVEFLYKRHSLMIMNNEVPVYFL